VTALQVILTKTGEGMLARCQDSPEITVTGKNKKSIRDNLREIINGHAEASPEAKGDFFNGDRMRRVVLVER